MISYINKSITLAESGIVVHGVNTKKVMGSGVALAIKTRWPIVYDKYMKQPGGDDMLGTSHIFAVENNIYVANCYTQIDFGSDGKRYADPIAVEHSLKGVYRYAELMWLDVHIPYKMASDLAGLDWDSEVYPIILRLNNSYGADTTIWSIH